MSAKMLFDDLEARIAPFNPLKHPFYQAWSAGELTRTDLREYAAEYWHAVSAFPTYLSALHAQLPDSDLRRTVLMNLCDEEGVCAHEGPPHSEIWMDFARGMGADPAWVIERSINPETRALIETFRELMHCQPAEALAALYTYESRVPEIARTKADGLASHYDADDATLRYFMLHEKADIFHAQVWRDALIEQTRGNVAAEAKACDAAEKASRAVWAVLDGVERQRQSRMQHA